jgi:iron complex transport system substrate-binding protein
MKKTLLKYLSVTLAIAILAGSLAGCSKTTPTNSTSTVITSQPSQTTTATTTPVTTTSTPMSTTTTTAATTRTITDMYGTQITVPAVVNRVIATGPVETQLIYMLAPEKLVGLSSAWNDNPSYIPAEYTDIPVIGNSSNGSFNYEAAVATKPDLVLEGKTKNLATDREKFGTIPVVGVNAGDDLLTMYEPEIRYVADLLGVPERGDALIAYYKQAMDYVNKTVANIPDSEKVRVYYAEGNDGLQTDAAGSWHTNLLAFCGGINVANVAVSNTSQAVQVSMEQIYAWDTADPINMIIIGRTSQASTYNAIMTSSNWQQLSCVRKGNVVVRPDNPTSWFDGPPGYGQILGMYWMLHTLYSAKTADMDLSDKVKEFYSDFLHYNLTQGQLVTLLSNPN